MKLILAVIFSFISVVVLHAANPAFTDFFGTNGIVIRTNGNKVQVDGSALASSNALSSANVWTNEAFYARLVRGSTNSLKVLTNGLQGIFIGDTNVASEGFAWPQNNISYMSLFDGSGIHDVNEWIHGVYQNDAADDAVYARITTTMSADPTYRERIFTQTNTVQTATLDLQLHNAGAYLTLERNLQNYVGMQVDVDPFATWGNRMIFAQWNNAEIFSVRTNGQLTLNTIAYMPPPSQGAAATVLTNDGSGNLGWGTAAQSLSGTTNFMNLSVQAAKLPATNYPGIDAGWQAWETVYSETNAEGSRVNLSASWQLIVPPDYTTNSLSLLINYSLINTNGPNTSNVIFGASCLAIRSGTTNNVHTNLFGFTAWGTNDWIAKYDGTNIVTNLVVNLGTNSAIKAGDMAVLKVSRDSVNDTFGGAIAVHGLQLYYTRP